MSQNNYRIPLIGFSWNSKPDPNNVPKPWIDSKIIAKDNGTKLGQFIFDFKQDILGISFLLGNSSVISYCVAIESLSTYLPHSFTVCVVKSRVRAS